MLIQFQKKVILFSYYEDPVVLGSLKLSLYYESRSHIDN